MSDTHARLDTLFAPLLTLGAVLVVSDLLKTLRAHRELLEDTAFLIRTTVAGCPAPVFVRDRDITVEVADPPKAAKPRAAGSGPALRSVK